jgi:hypothetical protein
MNLFIEQKKSRAPSQKTRKKLTQEHILFSLEISLKLYNSGLTINLESNVNNQINVWMHE